MPNKTEEYLALACKTADSFSRQWEHWAEFLITAARLYKYSYPDQLMIYARRSSQMYSFNGNNNGDSCLSGDYTSTHSTAMNFRNTESFNPCPEKVTAMTTVLWRPSLVD